ncbi:NAD-dependent epimerase/dehydratase family protein [Anabaena sp. UHCC 0187]|uniref:NAD-dependent epimerase/dehydratase family protein n=1 Tax=Anabaena sp. UHCC 0187 TaxID=2590018 RepID=UPI0014477F7A|nr:NAD-dependent epimerase/dehydratase family protein [Anabaena sp. UHCC 0187]MTJ11522.1 NAD-dependent epimerase/dehydratase family protein [Anabaena sp. UHCC 0187]
MKAIITGGCGFIGSHLVDSLLDQGVYPIIYDNFSTGNLENLNNCQEQIKVISGDIRDLDTLQRTIKNVDWVFHLAAHSSVSGSLANPLLTHEINNTGTLNVLWAALQAKVSRVVIASSCSVYGDIHQPPLQETYLPDPKSPYAASKLTAEALAESFYYSYGLETVCLRYFNVYGSRQRADSDYAAVIPRFIECYHQKKPPKIYGTGQQSRDFIHVSDVARANILAATLPSSILKKYRIFNIGTGNKTNLVELLNLISKQTNYYLEPTFLPSRQGEIEHSCADISLSQEKLDFQPLISLEEGIKSLL